MSESWIDAGSADRMSLEDVAPFEHEGRQYALYRTADGRYFATDGICTHEYADLAEGYVSGTIIECPMHNGRFDFTTGEAKGAPACIDLKTYPVRIEGGRLFLKLG
jgi:3-phenylpropionate/trans-cinnamate dioxygenase ferredoxin subunit